MSISNEDGVRTETAPPEGSLAGLGRLSSLDPRDRAYALPRGASVRTFRSWLAPGPVLDQGGTSMCVAYSGGKYLLTHPVVNALPDLPALYRDCQLLDEWPGEDYDGTSVRALMKVLKSRGLISEYRWATDCATLANALLERGPVVLGTTWHWDMFVPDRWGYIWPTGGAIGGHAYLAVCCNSARRNPDGTVGAIRILNSWGEGWGQRGRAWISFGSVQTLLDDWGEAAMATEVRVR